MREGTFKIDRALEAVGKLEDQAVADFARVQDPYDQTRVNAFGEVMTLLREIRETDAGQKP